MDILNTIGDYTIFNELGVGGFGTVYLVGKDEKYFAIKQFHSKKGERLGEFRSSIFSVGGDAKQEIDLLIRLDHPNIVKGYEVFIIETDNYKTNEIDVSVNLVMELGQGDLQNHLSVNRRLSDMYGIISGMKFLSDNNYYHCDLKLANILIVNGMAKIADPGLAINKYHTTNMIPTRALCNPVLNRAPELFYDEPDQYFARYMRDEERKINMIKYFTTYKKFLVDYSSYTTKLPGFYKIEDLQRAEFYTIGRLFMDIYVGHEPSDYMTLTILLVVSIESVEKRMRLLHLLPDWPIKGSDREIPGMTHLISRLLDGNPNTRLTSFEEILASQPFQDTNYTVFNKGLVVSPSLSPVQDSDFSIVNKIIVFAKEFKMSLYYLSKALSLYFAIINVVTESVSVETLQEVDELSLPTLDEIAIMAIFYSIGRQTFLTRRFSLLYVTEFWRNRNGYYVNMNFPRHCLNTYIKLQGIITVESTSDYTSSGNTEIRALKYYVSPEIMSQYSISEYVLYIEKEGFNTVRLPKNIPVPLIYQKLINELFIDKKDEDKWLVIDL